MKRLDRYIQKARISKALQHFPRNFESIFDIGCGDGTLLRFLDEKRITYHGCDPSLSASSESGRVKIVNQPFPSSLDAFAKNSKYDVVTALAVFEHLEEEELSKAGVAISNILETDGRLIITVPNPLVDRILHVLIWLRLIDGQMTHEHHGFQPKNLQNLFSPHLKQIAHHKFQWGLNNIFVFEKRAK